MNEIFYDYVNFWKHEGQLSPRDSLSFRLTPEHKEQEKPLTDAVHDIKPNSILEIGAGWGRIANLLRNNGYDGTYTAMDLSYERLKQIQDKSIGRIVADFMDYPLDTNYDLILAIEILMHIPPDIIDKFVTKMKRHCKTIISLDYDPKMERDIVLADHNFLHDYDKLFPNAKINQVNYVQKMRIFKCE